MKPSDLFVLLFGFFGFLNGQTWQKVPGPVGCELTALEANEHFIAAGIKKQGLFVSSSQGQSWTHVSSDDINLTARDSGLILCQGDSLYVLKNNGTILRKKSTNFSSMYTRNGVIFGDGYWSGNKYSLDTGSTWLDLPFKFRCLAITDSAWYSGYNELKISRDGGSSWQTVSTIPSTVSISFLVHNQSNVWAAGNHHVFHSPDHGHTWYLAYSNAYAYLRDVEILRDTLYLSSDNLLIRSGDLGYTWDTVKRAVYVNSGSSQYITAANNKLFRGGFGIYALHAGSTWSRADQGIYFGSAYKLDASNGLLYCVDMRDGYVSSDNGSSWRLCTPIDSTYSGWNQFYFNHGVLFGTDWHNGIYRSLDTGLTWQYMAFKYYSFFSGGIIYDPPNIYCTDAISDPNGNPNWKNYGRVHKSSDEGLTWKTTHVDSAVTPHYTTRSEIAWSGYTLLFSRETFQRSSSTVDSWLHCDSLAYPRNLRFGNGHFYCLSQNKLYRSDSWGQNWGQVTTPYYYTHLAVTDQYLAAYQGDSIHFSGNGGQTWQRLPVPPGVVADITIAPPYLYLSVANNSIWRMPFQLTTDVTKEQVMKSPLLWPNPASTYVNLVNPGDVRIYDITGREVYHLSSTSKFSVSTLPSGVYVCEVITDTQVQRTRLLVE